MVDLMKLVQALGSRVAASVAISALLITQSAAGVRPQSDFSPFLDLDSSSRAAPVFRKGGIAGRAGGVAFQGGAKFFLEQNGNPTPVSSSTLKFDISNDKNVFLVHDGIKYQVEIHKGLACPLAKFTARGGVIAFTVPPSAPDGNQGASLAALVADGVTDGESAQEFQGTKFVPVLAAADFAATDSLPLELEEKLRGELNSAVSPAPREVLGGRWAGGSYINTDVQVTYQVYLNKDEKRVDISGVPLRYYWNWAADESAIIDRIMAMSQDFEDVTALANLDEDGAWGGSDVTQYDAVSLYQNAGLFRQMRQSNPTQFAAFVSAACTS